MKFRFSLDSVLRVRKHEEELQKQKLAEKVQKKENIHRVRAEVEKKLKQHLEYSSRQSAPDIRRFKRQCKHMEQIHQVMNHLEKELNQAEKRVRKEQEKLSDAYKKRHVLEKVKESEWHAFTEKKSKKEQKTMDEIATQTYNR